MSIDEWLTSNGVDVHEVQHGITGRVASGASSGAAAMGVGSTSALLIAVTASQWAYQLSAAKSGLDAAQLVAQHWADVRWAYETLGHERSVELVKWIWANGDYWADRLRELGEALSDSGLPQEVIGGITETLSGAAEVLDVADMVTTVGFSCLIGVMIDMGFHSWNKDSTDRLERLRLRYREALGVDVVFTSGSPPRYVLDNVNLRSMKRRKIGRR